MDIKIGDVVRSKNEKGQIKITGMVMALIKADFYENHMIPKGVKLDSVWGVTCPGWRDGLVAIVWFNIPQRTATLEEWTTSGIAQGYSEEKARNSYERNCPIVQYTCFPVNDLEVVNE